MTTQFEKIYDEAKDRFKRCETWEAAWRPNYIADTKMANADSLNLWAWDDNLRNERLSRNAPCLTINKAFQHCQILINDQRQNQYQVEIRPVGNGASFKAAEVLEGICRHIEVNSNAQAAYTAATSTQIIGGLGYWRIVCEYAHDDSFDQEIFIRRIADPLSIYLDPDIQEADGSDAKFAFIFRDMTRDDFEAEYPRDVDDVGSSPPLGEGDYHSGDAWDGKNKVRVAEYFRRKMVKDKLHLLDNGTTVRESEVKGVDDEGYLTQLQVHSVNYRDIETPQIEWFLIAGSKIIDRKDWPGKYIPIVRLPGLETVIEGTLDRRGQMRQLTDPAKLYNWWSSSAVEQVALQTKTPWIADEEAIGPYQNQWRLSNIKNQPYLLYKSKDEAGNPIPPPQRAQPPVMSDAYLSGLKIAADEMQMATSQYDASFGNRTNEISGVAIDSRQRGGEKASFHFVDRFTQSLRHTGRILVDLIPKIYDSERILTILGEDGTQSAIQVKPDHVDQNGNPLAHSQVQNPDDDDYDPAAISAILNPTVGNYAVECDSGPSYNTRRQETFAAISKILQSDMALAPVIGDLLFKAADFPMADEIAERLHRMVSPQALGTAPDPQIGQLQQMLAQQHQEMVNLQNQLAMAKNKAATTEQQKEIDQYRADTERMKALGGIDPAAMMPVIRQLVSEALGMPVNPIIAAHAQENAAMAQPPAPPPAPPQIQQQAPPQ